jgi:hypothetical protein
VVQLAAVVVEEVVHLQPVMLLDKMVQMVEMVEHQVLRAETPQLRRLRLLELVVLVEVAVAEVEQ